MPINFCTGCKVGLANEEVVNGVCERCGSPVVQKEKSEWMLKITDYAQKFIDDLDDINGYDEINKNDIGDLEIAISKLPENYKQVFLLKFSHELTDNEISEILDIKPDNVRKRISRGREKLKNILKKMVFNIILVDIHLI